MGELIAIDLFSGAGGTTAGLKKAGINVRLAVELNKIAAKTYTNNNPEVFLICDNIQNVSSQELKNNINMSDEDMLLLVACPPCQGFSSIRKNGIDDERNELIFEYLRCIQDLKPEFLLMENVAGMTRGIGKDIFAKFKNMVSENYDIVYDVLNSADYGVPQNRKRLVLHGIRKDVVVKMKKYNKELGLPIKTHSKIGGETPKWINADVILGLPEIRAGEEYQGKDIYNHLSNNLSDINIERIRHIRNNGGSRKSLPDNLSLDCHKNTKGHGDVYGILDINKPSITITGGCMSYSKGRFGHPYQDRALSAREAARLQSFDDDYIFFGKKGALAKQIGNAVPVKLAQASGFYFVDLFHTMEEKK
ncbi:DNA cytosine methyltransferase [Carnobacterium divergens]|uniref:DNA cytosine methyltransferase n=1 Tax=Carnobacterium divergens TaxID=2748 RepID=UPI0039AEC7AB